MDDIGENSTEKPKGTTASSNGSVDLDNITGWKNGLCVLCNERRTDEGHDPCLGALPGVRFACCGHGVEQGYISFEPASEHHHDAVSIFFYPIEVAFPMKRDLPPREDRAFLPETRDDWPSVVFPLIKRKRLEGPVGPVTYARYTPREMIEESGPCEEGMG